MWLQGNYIIWKGQRMRRGKIPAARGEVSRPLSSPWEKSDAGKAASLLCLQASEASPAPLQNGAIHAECDDDRRPFSRGRQANSSCSRKVTGAWRPACAKVHTFPVGTPFRPLVKNPNCAQRTFIELGSVDTGMEGEAPRGG